MQLKQQTIINNRQNRQPITRHVQHTTTHSTPTKDVKELISYNIKKVTKKISYPTYLTAIYLSNYSRAKFKEICFLAPFSPYKVHSYHQSNPIIIIRCHNLIMIQRTLSIGWDLKPLIYLTHLNRSIRSHKSCHVIIGAIVHSHSPLTELLSILHSFPSSSQQPTTNNQQPTTNLQPPTSNLQPPTSNL